LKTNWSREDLQSYPWILSFADAVKDDVAKQISNFVAQNKNEREPDIE